MIDSRFYQKRPPLKLSQIAEFASIGGGIGDRDDIVINSVAPLNEATQSDIAYCEKAKNGEIITNAGACFVRQADINALPSQVAPLVVDNPRAAFSQIANYLVDIHDNDVDIQDGIIEDGAIIHEKAIIAKSASIGRGTKIGANSFIGIGVSIGRNCVIGPNCVIDCALIGDNVKIGANSVIGKAGFGIVPSASSLLDVPHFGRVVIQDNVSIGALCTVDRGVFGDTIIGISTKIDNHCHIAHNVTVGKSVIMAAYAGISGSVQIGDYVMMGGRVGVGDHFKIGNGARLAACSVILSDVPAGETYGGYPAKPRVKWMREIVKLARLASEK